MKAVPGYRTPYYDSALVAVVALSDKCPCSPWQKAVAVVAVAVNASVLSVPSRPRQTWGRGRKKAVAIAFVANKQR
ncbi:MAG: hypothetical protein QGH15_21410 [Kiritimatiellia bacterium]|nr:hypothetical protein [Kiritimatiellia bacterium]